MQRLIAANECPIEDLDLVGDDLMRWRFKIRSFDDSSQGAGQRSSHPVLTVFSLKKTLPSPSQGPESCRAILLLVLPHSA